ncbi:MAG: cobyric acid synthase [Deltaproteobacteria bacterium]|nr:cobyric acid synthase [Deltaproteobacteria bacterium]
MAKAIMVQGTGSHVGKSIITAGLCRIFKNMGYKVAPFKAQNMALNSAVAKEGGEIGRAQAIQAEACGIEPSIHMNPVLLKPNSDMGSQVIIHGKAIGNMKAREYYAFKNKAWEAVCESYERLATKYEVIVIEGAGSPAEVNLKENDIVNMKIAEMAGAKVILVSDIDRGGVFAALIGTMELLTPSEREMVCGFIINKFRGDKTLLEPGLDFIEKRTGVPVLGVVPYLRDMGIGEEDSVALEKSEVRSQKSEVRSQKSENRVGCARQIEGTVPDLRTECNEVVESGLSPAIKIGVIRLPHISNYTDFDPLQREPDVQLSYIQRPEEIAELDLVIIPGSKNTIDDLLFLRETGLAEVIKRYCGNGKYVVGICGGYQILGLKVSDPHGVETDGGSEEGLGLLPVETIMLKEKVTANVEAFTSHVSHLTSHILNGYEIHMGESMIVGDAKPLFVIRKRNGDAVEMPDGAITKDGRCWGTYIHGIFDNDGFRRDFLNCIRREKGFDAVKGVINKDDGFDQLAAVLIENLDVERILIFTEDWRVRLGSEAGTSQTI